MWSQRRGRDPDLLPSCTRQGWSRAPSSWSGRTGHPRDPKVTQVSMFCREPAPSAPEEGAATQSSLRQGHGALGLQDMSRPPAPAQTPLRPDPLPELRGWRWGPRASAGGWGEGTFPPPTSLIQATCLVKKFSQLSSHSLPPNPTPTSPVQRALGVGGGDLKALPQPPDIIRVSLTFPEHCAMVARLPSLHATPRYSRQRPAGSAPPTKTKNLLGLRIRGVGSISPRGAAQPATQPTEPRDHGGHCA